MTKKFTEILGLPTPDLLLLYGEILEKLREREVVRSSNNPAADYAELLVRNALGLTMTPNSTKGYDAIDAQNVRYQIKARRPTEYNDSRQLSAIRGLDAYNFDFLIGVLFNEDFTVQAACQIPHAIVQQQATYKKHVNGWLFHLRDSVWDCAGVIDLTTKLMQVKVA